MNTQSAEKASNTPEEILYKKGFGTLMNEELKEKMAAGRPEFFTECTMEVERGENQPKDQLNFRVHWRRDDDPQKDKVYLNSFDIMIKSPDFTGIRQQNIAAGSMITALEAYRMLKYGDQVAVNKDLYNKEGQPYNTWISIDVAAPKDEYGNYPLKTFHENYYSKHPFDLREVLKNLPVEIKGLQSAEGLERTARMLEKAHLVHTSIKQDGQWTSGHLAVNPAKAEVCIYDKQMQLISVQQAKPDQSPSQNAAEDVKKKPGQKLNDRYPHKQGRGI